MSKVLSKKLIMLLAVLIMLPIFSNWNVSTASSAATPKFAKSKIELVGEGEVYQLDIKNKVAKSKYKWTSSNKKVVKVSSKGVVTTVGGGTATIKCTITYPNKKTKTLSCKVTVKVPAEVITITNVTEVNGAVTMTLGSTMTFTSVLKPAKSTDKVYWYISGGDSNCITVDDPLTGKVTAKKTGFVTLEVAAAASASATAAKKSKIDDAIIIEVVGPKAEVQSAEIISTTELRVIFDSPVKPDTVLGTNGKLSSNIEILAKKDTKGVIASDPGTLTGVLSADGKTLTITSSATFGGNYYLVCSSNILTTTGVKIDEYGKSLTFIDNYPPTYTGTTVDDAGFKATISFSEPMDFSGLSVVKPTVSREGATLSGTTATIIGNRLNYVASTDKKSLIIDLSNIATTDYGRIIPVSMAGLKDMAGNSPINYTITVDVRTDNSLKPQAIPMTVNRTGYYTLTATFTRSISYPGLLQIRNGNMLQGVIDPNDNKKVNYTLNETDAALSGYNMVKLMMWNSYNVLPTDTSAQTGREFSIDFSIDKSNPVLLSYEYDVANTTLTLTYNKEVSLAASTGVFTTRLTTITDEIIPGSNVSYTNIPYTTDKKVIKLKMSNMSVLGSYAISMQHGFVIDGYKNPSLARDILVSNSSGSSTELPAPYAIMQNAANLNQVYIEFANRLDEASARNVSNYSIPGVQIISAELYKNTTNNGATVILTLAENSIDVTIERPVRINGVMGYNNSYTPLVGYEQLVLLKDTSKPRLVSNPVFDTVTKNIIKLNFNEQITGNLVVKVSYASNSAVVLPQTVTINGNTANITLSSLVPSGTSLKIEIVNNTLVDSSGNAAALDPAYFIGVFY